MKLNCLSLALLAAGTLPAAAASPPQGEAPAVTVQRIVERMDRDNDGQVSLEEYRNTMMRRFHAADRNADGALQSNEVPPEWVVVPAADLADGRVTLDEFSDELPAGFNAFDSSGDGRLDNAELNSLASARAAKLETSP